MINLILWLLFGALIGWLASLVMRTDAQQGLLMNIIVGIVGAFLGGSLANLLHLGAGFNSIFDIWSWIVAIVGAVVLIWLVRMFTGRRV